MWRGSKYLLDMLLTEDDAQDIVAGLSLDAFECNRTTRQEVRALQVIGEAANRVSIQTQVRSPSPPCLNRILRASTTRRKPIGLRRRRAYPPAMNVF
jgi:uncharacterized protein with HEPN domain